MDQYIGKMLDNRYEILEVIGVGGMAVVYKAMCHRLNRPVAIKILKDEYLDDADFRRRFHAESQAVAMMSHPNIVNVYDVSKSESRDYIVMELIDGITLKQYMERKGALSWRETLHFSMQIAKALEHAHSRNIIHRDIKPHNIMILKDGSVKVADFGIARVASAQNTLTKEALGSVHYISPEQAKGSRVDNRTDIYSLGVVMYQMLTGRTPYDGDSPVSVAIQHINGTPLLPSLLNGNIPTGLEQITMHAMCADLGKRYASAADMLRDMEEFRKNPGTVFSFTPDGSSIATSPSAPLGAAPIRQGEPRQIRRATQEDYEFEEREARKKQLLTIGLVVLGVALLIGLLLLAVSLAGGNGENPTEDPSETEQLPIVVPDLRGEVWDEIDLKEYPDLEFIVDQNSYVYSSIYPEGTVCEQSIRHGTEVEAGTKIYLNISLGEQTDEMPDFTGRSLDYVQAYIKALSVDVTLLTEEIFDEEMPEGFVIRTDPAKGASLKAGEIITVFVSKGPENVKLKVPAVIGTSLANAKASLEGKNLKYTAVEEYSATVAAGYVIDQSPAANTEVTEGTVVTLTVSKGKETITVPSVVGKDVATATNELEQAGFVVTVSQEYSSTVSASYVISQSAPASSEMMPGSSITIIVSKGPEPVVTEPTDAILPTEPDAPDANG